MVFCGGAVGAFEIEFVTREVLDREAGINIIPFLQNYPFLHAPERRDVVGTKGAGSAILLSGSRLSLPRKSSFRVFRTSSLLCCCAPLHMRNHTIYK